MVNTRFIDNNGIILHASVGSSSNPGNNAGQGRAGTVLRIFSGATRNLERRT